MTKKLTKKDVSETTTPAESAEKTIRQPRKRRKRKKKQLLPVFPLRDNVLFPFTITSLSAEDPEMLQLVDEAVAKDRLIAVVPAEEVEKDGKHGLAFHGLGCVGRIIKTLRLPDSSQRILVRGVKRIIIKNVIEGDAYPIAEVVPLVEKKEEETIERQAIAQAVAQQFQALVSKGPQFPEELRVAAFNVDDNARLVDLIADTINLSFEEKVQILGNPSLNDRLEMIVAFLSREEILMQLGGEIQNKVGAAFAESQREQFLREQLKVIQEQLGESNETADLADLKTRLAEADLPEEVRDAAEKEFERLKMMHPSAGDYNVSRTYIDWLLILPWRIFSTDQLDINEAKRILDRDHYDLVKVKERVLEYLAVLQLKKDMKSPILCFVGPPGVGKTSLGRSIADALGREFVRISLGGVRDEAEIRGHRRTYVGALPGRIIQGLKRAKTGNPVFMLDEIDKLGNDFRGDPASALLEVLDPQQNDTFADHYLELPFDLSNILFITTANLLDPIPPALKDRMEVIHVPGYTQNEKYQIAKRFLVPRQMQANGLKRRQLTFYKSALDEIISVYTAEAGVRNLEREIGAVCRKHARALVEGSKDPKARKIVKSEDIRGYLGPRRLFPDMAVDEPRIGHATGMAWTSVGGEILHIEATLVPGKGNLVLTGSLGDVMKESCQIALNYVRSQSERLGIDCKVLEKNDIHVHVPAGATPKDGPSAGTAMATALASLLSGRPAKPFIAMTGEITLRGRVLPVGGVKEKVLAAARSGIREILLPDQNAGDLEEDVPVEILNKIKFHLIKDAGEALKLTLV